MNKKEFKDPYTTACLSRLTRILDLDVLEDLQEVEESGNVAKNLDIELSSKINQSFFSKSSQKLNRIISKRNNHVKLFGNELTEDSVNRILPLIEHLKLHVDKEGLFRVSGNKKRQEELKELLDQGEKVKVYASDKFTAHDVASVLKQFLGELPEPLLTNAPYTAYIQTTDQMSKITEHGSHQADFDKSKNSNFEEIRNDDRNTKHIEAFQLLFLLIPPENRALLHSLLQLLRLVVDNPHNRMTAHNLAVVFSPNIMHKKKMSVSCLSHIPEDMEAMNEVVAFMISHARQLFKVSAELKQEIALVEQNIRKGKEDEVPMARVYCQQVAGKDLHHTVVRKQTTDALLELYCHVVDMPDGPTKQKFLEQFEKAHPGTPPFVRRTKKMTSKSSLVCSTPVNSPARASCLTRTPFSPITNRPSSSPALRTPLNKKVAFVEPDIKRRKASHFMGIKTPSGLLTSFKSPHKRTLSGNKVSFSPSRTKHLRSRSAKTPSGMFRRTRTQAETPMTPSAHIKDGYATASPLPSETTSASIMKMYTAPVSAGIRRRIASADLSVEEHFV